MKVNEKAELLPFSRWMMKRLSPPNSFWNRAQFLRRARGHSRQLLELFDADRAAHFERADVVARQDEAIGLEEIVLRLVVDNGIRRQVAHPAMRAQRLDELVEFAVVGRDHAAFHGRDVMREERAESREMPERAGSCGRRVRRPSTRNCPR